ncbi:MAG: ribonuclease R [Zetaproteobacteria bacterium]|nr:MAG: ribonuclease R [Zetaproteobacteria bacterium]
MSGTEGQALSWHKLCAQLGIRQEDKAYQDVEALIRHMEHQGEIKRQGRKLALVDNHTWVGTVSAHPDGFGFVDTPDREKGIFLPREEMRGLMHGDKVEVRIVRRRGRESGELIRIIEHAPSIIVARITRKGDMILAEPRSRRMPQTIRIRKEHVGQANDGDWVRLSIERGSNPPWGKVKEVIGSKLDPKQLIDLVIIEQQLPESFPAPVQKEAESIAGEVDPLEHKERLNLMHLPFVTIDGEDARDFDDAIFVAPRGEGFEAWVAIADVAHYVLPGSDLDAEALKRGNSYYFPDRVLPMLPESLSNGVCSLNPHVPRLVMAVRLRFDANGICRSTRIHEAVIRSHARLTYGQASRWLEHRDAHAIEDGKIRQMLEHALRLHNKLARRRRLRGALDLDVPEVRAVLHEGRLSHMAAGERNVAHHLIEELMLAANTAVAQFFAHQHCPLLYRVHAPPEREAIESLNHFLAPFGVFIPLPKGKGKVKPGDVQRVLEEAEGKPYAHVLHRLVLRSMQQAKYTPTNEGHFGLAYQHYCHFTSPIRRYADLTVHRRLKALIRNLNPDKVQPASKLAEIGEHVSTTERVQQRAEWDIQAMLAALYHQRHVGEEMQAIVSGLSKRRVFVELQPSLAEGSLSLDDLDGEYLLDERAHRLYARHGRGSIGLGDTIRVRLERTDPVRGRIDVSLLLR